MNISKEQFTKLAKDHLIALESYKIDKNGNAKIQIFGIEELYEAINYTGCCKSVKSKQVPTFDEFIDKFNLEADIDNEYFFDNEYFDAMGLYYKYAEHYGINP